MLTRRRLDTFARSALASAGGLLAAGAALAAEPAGAAWQRCAVQAEPAQRLTCYDQWANEQQALLRALDDKARQAAASPSRNTAPSAAAAEARADVAAAVASAQPAPDESAPARRSGGATGVIGVGLEQGCRDRQFSEMSRFWELESGSSCPTFGLRSFRPATVALAASDKVNRQPASPNPANSAGGAIDYGRQAMRFQVSVRTKLASGLLTPADGTLRDSLWAAYSQQSEWQVFNGALSRPFRNTDHMPELIYVYPTTARLGGGWLWRYSGLGLMHQSNGQSDPLSRSWNRVYAMTGFEMDERLSIEARAWKRLSEAPERDNNPDITRYLGHGDVTAQWTIDRKNALRATYSGLGGRGSGRIAWTRSLGDGLGNSASGLRLYVSLFHGYGDSLLDYNFKRTVFSVGLSLVDF